MTAKRLLAAWATVAVVGAALVTGGSSASATLLQLPWQARFSGSAAFTSPTTTVFDGHGTASYMGRIESDGHVCLPSPTCTPTATVSCPGGIPNVNVEMLTALNVFGKPTGDTLTITSQDVACPIGPGQFQGSGHWSVSSGTGRFRHATGHGTFAGHVDFNAGTYTMTLIGTVGSIALI